MLAMPGTRTTVADLCMFGLASCDEGRIRSGPGFVHASVRTVTNARQVELEEQLREDQQELRMREQKKRAKDARRIRGIVQYSDKNKGISHVQDEMGKLMHHDEQELLSL